MDKRRVTGAAAVRNAGGRIEEGFGGVAGDTKSRFRGSSTRLKAPPQRRIRFSPILDNR